MSLRVEVIDARGEAARAQAADRAAAVLAQGGLVVHPTETVYGLGGDGSPGNNELVARIKRRDLGQPLLLLTPDLATLQASFAGLEWPERARLLASTFWPGPLTLVVPCADAPDGLRGPGGGLAVRISPDPTVAAILARWQRPMTSSSANLSGTEPAQTLEGALQVFVERSDLQDVSATVLALDAGPTLGTRGSTIVSFVDSPPRLLREGPVTRGELAKWLPELSA